MCDRIDLFEGGGRIGRHDRHVVAAGEVVGVPVSRCPALGDPNVAVEAHEDDDLAVEVIAPRPDHGRREMRRRRQVVGRLVARLPVDLVDVAVVGRTGRVAPIDGVLASLASKGIAGWRTRRRPGVDIIEQRRMVPRVPVRAPKLVELPVAAITGKTEVDDVLRSLRLKRITRRRQDGQGRGGQRCEIDRSPAHFAAPR